MKRRGISRVRFWIEGLLWAAGCLALGYCAFVLVSAQLAQSQGNRALEQAWKEGSPGEGGFPTDHPEGSLVGRMEIRRIHLSAVVFEGTSDFTLARGVGHMTSSGSLGKRGNIVFAGHRDTFFRELRKARKGDEIVITGSQGQFWYRVNSLFIVSPDQVEVLRPGAGESLTLITCYPFSYLGSAPQRYIVRAEKMEASSTEGNPSWPLRPMENAR
jgi:sortase A